MNIPIATGRIDNETVIVGVLQQDQFEDLWSFEIGLDDSDFIQRQMKLPLCVICDESSVVYVKQKDVTPDVDISYRIRSNDSGE